MDVAPWEPLSGLMAYVQPGQAFGIPKEYATVMDRGVPTMHKLMSHGVTELTFTVLGGVTAEWPTANTAEGPSSLGLSVGQFNFEWKQAIETVEGDRTGIWYQFHRAVLVGQSLTESEEGNQVQFTIRAAAVQGPTASGYLS